MSADDVLINALNEAKILTVSRVKKEIIDNVDVLINYIDTNKSLVSALTTSLVKKILEPNQDIRLHRVDFENGYSARSLDTNFITPFFKEHFPRYANKETAFLTLATREKIPWKLKEGNALKIRNIELKIAFLQILHNIQVRNQSPWQYLVYIFHRLFELSQKEHKILLASLKDIKKVADLNINTVIAMLKKHFSTKHSSRLPVLAIYSVYQELVKSVNRYSDKNLLKLNVHTSLDKHSFGDIEIYNKDRQPFEVIEIKHNISIDRYLIFDIIKKIENQPISKYYILTTHPNNFESEDEENYINDLVLSIKKEYGFEIIVNGIINSLKYYLRFIDNYHRFVENYTNNLIKDFKYSTEVKPEHISVWKEIISQHFSSEDLVFTPPSF
ncbi:MAG: DNA methyltransferase [Ignavibacteria bacterium]|nr:DNA methyltransferase [Ignavibacteria bacterium]